MDRITRKELKTDRFAEEVSHTFEYFTEHRQQLLRYGGAALAVLVLAGGYWLYSRHQKTVLQAELHHAMRVRNGAIGPANSDVSISFPNREERDKAVQKALNDLLRRAGNKPEGIIARYYLGVEAAEQGKMADAEKEFKQVIERGDKNYASLAKLALAEVYQAQGRTADAEKLFRSLIEKPTLMVSKEQATIALARMLGPIRPADARKLLEPLRGERSAVSRAALAALAEIPKQ